MLLVEFYTKGFQEYYWYLQKKLGNKILAHLSMMSILNSRSNIGKSKKIQTMLNKLKGKKIIDRLYFNLDHINIKTKLRLNIMDKYNDGTFSCQFMFLVGYVFLNYSIIFSWSPKNCVAVRSSERDIWNVWQHNHVEYDRFLAQEQIML